VFDKTDRLTEDETYDGYEDEPHYKNYVKAMFYKTIDYTDLIYINVEINTSMIEFDASKNDKDYNYNLKKVKEYIDTLLGSTIRSSNELQILFQNLLRNNYYYNETNPLTRTSVQTVFVNKTYQLIVKIEFNPLDITHLYDADNNDEGYDYNLINVKTDVNTVVNKLLKLLLARGKIKNRKLKKRQTKKPKKLKRKQSRRK
jgi:hypothetical protein